MRTVSYRLDDLRKAVIRIGKVAENEYTRVQIDAGDIYADYPHASAALTVQPPAGEPYPAVVTRNGNLVIWDVKDSDLVNDGDGEIQLTFTAGETVIKGPIGRISVCRSIIGEGEAPDPLEDFLAEAGAALTAIPETIDAALEAAKESGEFDGPPGADGQDGVDGYSPSASVSKSGSTATITITDKNGTTTAEVSDGQDGSDGQPGADGYSPTASVSKSGKTATITITDKNGTTTAQISDGEDGQGSDVIDDTAGSGTTDKTWSANKLSELNSALNSKVSEPQIEGTSGQVLTTDGNGGRSWTTPSGGGGVTDVQIDGTTILNQGVANIPLASTSNVGLVKTEGGKGIAVNSSGRIYTDSANSTQIKAGTQGYNPIVPANQHESMFYGLAKASGDTTQSSSSNAVGTYTESAKSSISQMLDAPETVSGTTPSITAKSGVRYVCGECATLSITAPASGCIDVVFTSGSTATVLTVTPTKTGVTAVKWANGFDPTSLDANTTYEVNILDGEFGVVGSWT